MSSRPDPLPLLLRAQAGDDDACEMLLFQHQAFIQSVALRRLGRHGEPLDELVQVGRIGFLKAIRRYNRDRDVRFSVYAYAIVDGEIRHHLRDCGHLIHLPSYLQSKGTPHPIIISTTDETGREWDEIDTTQDVEAAVLTRLIVIEALGYLTARQRQAVHLRFGGDLQITEISTRFGCTPKSVSELLKRALDRLKRQLVAI